MKSYSILSPNDGQLLIRFHDECVKAGMKSDEWWNVLIQNICTPVCLRTGGMNGIAYYGHSSIWNNPNAPELINLTPENFDEVLKKVIENS